MDRTRHLEQLCLTLAAVAQRRREDEAACEGWPLPDDLALHLWMYAEGLTGPTRLPDRDDFEGNKTPSS